MQYSTSEERFLIIGMHSRQRFAVSHYCLDMIQTTYSISMEGLVLPLIFTLKIAIYDQMSHTFVWTLGWEK